MPVRTVADDGGLERHHRLPRRQRLRNIRAHAHGPRPRRDALQPGLVSLQNFTVRATSNRKTGKHGSRVVTKTDGRIGTTKRK